MTLLEAVHAAFRRGNYSPRTEEAYVHWIRTFIRFHGRRHPREMGAPAFAVGFAGASRPSDRPPVLSTGSSSRIRALHGHW